MENKFLDRELRTNHYYNEIFKRQKHNDLDTLIMNLKISGKDVIFELNINNAIPFCKNGSIFEPNSEEEKNYWNHVVALLFMNQLKEKYDIESDHNLEDEKRIITRLPQEEYLKYEDCLVNRDDIVQEIKKLPLLSPRVHIIVRYINSDSIWKELINYFDSDIPLITMIYTDGEMPIEISEEIKQKTNPFYIFNKDEDGEFIIQKSKNKGLIHEKKI